MTGRKKSNTSSLSHFFPKRAKRNDFFHTFSKSVENIFDFFLPVKYLFRGRNTSYHHIPFHTVKHLSHIYTLALHITSSSDYVIDLHINDIKFCADQVESFCNYHETPTGRNFCHTLSVIEIYDIKLLPIKLYADQLTKLRYFLIIMKTLQVGTFAIHYLLSKSTTSSYYQ